MHSLLVKIKKHMFKLLAVGIVLLMFGPELLAGAEFIAIVEFIGVDIFLLMYFYMVAGYCRQLLDKWMCFERESCYGCFGNYAKTESLFKNIMFFFVPERTLGYVLILSITATFSIHLYQLMSFI